MNETPEGKHINAMPDEAVTVAADGKTMTLEEVLKGLQAGTVTVTTANITDATEIGKSLVKAKDAATARQAIGAGTSSFDGDYTKLSNKPIIPAAYTLPQAGTAIGGVKKGTAVADAATDADIAAIITTLNALLASLRASGAIAS